MVESKSTAKDTEAAKGDAIAATASFPQQTDATKSIADQQVSQSKKESAGSIVDTSQVEGKTKTQDARGSESTLKELEPLNVSYVIL